MISSIQYRILKALQNGERINDQEDFEELLSLRKRGFVTYRDNEGYCLCGDWLIEVEEYENFLLSQQRQEETIKIAKDANRKANIANIISVAAIILSTLLSVLSLIFSLR